jgi:plasmid stability protein
MVLMSRAMSTTITLKNIPDALYDSLKQAAEAHHRSINSEVITCLERVLLPSSAGQEERLARARQIRGSLGSKSFKAADIAEVIQQGRP